MPPEVSSLEWTRRARAELESAQQLLKTPSPQSLDGCTPHLEEAASCLQRLQTGLQSESSQDPESRHELRLALARLRSDLAQIRSLIDHAAGFYQGWGRLLAAATQNYTAHGEVAQLPTIRRVWLDG